MPCRAGQDETLRIENSASSAAIAVVVITISGSPWVDAKALAIASPVFVFAAMVGAMALFGKT